MNCSVLLLLLSLCRNTPIEMHEGSLGFGEDRQHSEIFGVAPCFSDKKSEAIPAFCHWRSGQRHPPPPPLAPPAFTEFLRTPADCIVEFCLFLNK